MRDRYPAIYRVEDRAGRLITLDAALLVGRVLLVVLFITSGFNKLMALGPTATYIGGKLPMGAVLAPAVGILELIGGIMIAVGFQTRIAAAALFIFTLAATFIFHDFWNMTGQARSSNAINFYKNLAIMGAFLILVAAGPGRYSVDKR
jgi:putative oxidoreductase